MKWMDEYCLGVELIDKQHKDLFSVINRIQSILNDGDERRSRRTSVEGIKYLKSYVLRHFADEEAFQQQVGYEGFEKHRSLHVAFTQRVAQMEQEMLEDDYSKESISRFMEMVTQWLIHHIMNSDQAIVGKGPGAAKSNP